jgi:polar amino acid transport system substrate-binding protein
MHRMTRRLARFLAVALAAVPLAAGAQQAATPAAAARPSFLADGRLDICTSAGFAPMSYLRAPGDPRPIGFDSDLADALAELWGAQARFVVTEFPGLLPALAAQRCGVVISGIFVTDQRRQTFDGVPYLQTTTVLVTARGNASVNRPEDLSGRTLAVEAGTVYERMANALNEAFRARGQQPTTIQTYGRYEEIMQQVLIGRAAASLTQDVQAAFQEGALPGRLRIAFEYPEPNRFGIYLRRNPDDLAAVRAALGRLRETGGLAAIAARHNMPARMVEAVDHGS